MVILVQEICKRLQLLVNLWKEGHDFLASTTSFLID